VVMIQTLSTMFLELEMRPSSRVAAPDQHHRPPPPELRTCVVRCYKERRLSPAATPYRRAAMCASFGDFFATFDLCFCIIRTDFLLHLLYRFAS
jgi:hypothetical protein